MIYLRNMVHYLARVCDMLGWVDELGVPVEELRWSHKRRVRLGVMASHDG